MLTTNLTSLVSQTRLVVCDVLRNQQKNGIGQKLPKTSKIARLVVSVLILES
ncbi:unnamed protein product [Amoebophrya sp. A120]|nr:unnamed protein product [Amoebophrya sp. A120]|eukprot:GSA120T00011660001.1